MTASLFSQLRLSCWFIPRSQLFVKGCGVPAIQLNRVEKPNCKHKHADDVREWQGDGNPGAALRTGSVKTEERVV